MDSSQHTEEIEMAKRKTIEVIKFVDYANNLLRHDQTTEEQRIGVIKLTEQMLREIGNYQGFRYLTADEVAGRPGINYIDGQPAEDLKQRFDNTDPTRIQFF